MANPTLQPLAYDHDFSGMIHITRNGQHVAHMEKHNNAHAAQQEAYARAFVAAPDLLAAIKEMLAVEDGEETCEAPQDWQNIVARARAAVAKAESA